MSLTLLSKMSYGPCCRHYPTPLTPRPSQTPQAAHNVTAEISKLPPYLAVQFVRFYWRKDTKKKAKICRNVYFPTVLDMLPYCTEKIRIPIEKVLSCEGCRV